MIKKNANPHNIVDILDDLDNADHLICQALRTNGLTKSGDAIGRNALDALRRFIEALEEEAAEKFGALKFNGKEWL